MYQLKYAINLEKVLKYIPKNDQAKIIGFLDVLDGIKNPFSILEKMHGECDFYKYRVGNYRIVCKISKKELIILIVDIADRKHIYKRIKL